MNDSIQALAEWARLPQDQAAHGIHDLLTIGFLKEQGDGWQIDSPHFIGSMDTEDDSDV